MNTLEKYKVTASIWHTERFLRSGIPIYNFKILGMTVRKATTTMVTTYTFCIMNLPIPLEGEISCDFGDRSFSQ